MTDSDDKLLRRYRDLAREEPPRALDDAILAASRRALARPSWSRRWAAPLSIAAVLVLAFGVTLEMEREMPGVETQEPARSAPVVVPATPAAATAQAPQEEPPQAAVQAPVEARKAAAPRPMEEAAPSLKAREHATAEMKETTTGVAADAVLPARPAPEAFAPSPQSAPAAAAPMASMRDANIAPASPPAPATARALAAPRAKAETSESAQAPARAAAPPSAPERELERIAKLREEKRDEEADKALDEFRRRYPGFRIPDAMLARVRAR